MAIRQQFRIPESDRPSAVTELPWLDRTCIDSQPSIGFKSNVAGPSDELYAVPPFEG